MMTRYIQMEGRKLRAAVVEIEGKNLYCASLLEEDININVEFGGPAYRPDM